jgi:hypothetical protein
MRGRSCFEKMRRASSSTETFGIEKIDVDSSELCTFFHCHMVVSSTLLIHFSVRRSTSLKPVMVKHPPAEIIWLVKFVVKKTLCLHEQEKKGEP